MRKKNSVKINWPPDKGTSFNECATSVRLKFPDQVQNHFTLKKKVLLKKKTFVISYIMKYNLVMW